MAIFLPMTWPGFHWYCGIMREVSIATGRLALHFARADPAVAKDFNLVG